jgi:thiol peroxidase
MPTVNLEGQPVHTSGYFPRIGSRALDFSLTDNELSSKRLSDYKGLTIVLNVFPSLDTDVCAASVRKFNQEAFDLGEDVKVLNISMDLPFAQKRFCVNEGINDSEILSAFRNDSFGKNYGLEIIDGPLKGLLARAVIIIDHKLVIRYGELVPEISREPDYQKALNMLFTL